MSWVRGVVAEEAPQTQSPVAGGTVLFQCNFDGSDGATTAVDDSYLHSTITFHGDAALTTRKKKFGTASLWCPHLDPLTNNFQITGVRVPWNAAFDQLASGDFTFEFFFRPDALYASSVNDFDAILIQTSYFFLSYRGPSLSVQWRDNNRNFHSPWSNQELQIDHGMVANADFYHIAVGRASGTIRCHINGVLAKLSTVWAQGGFASGPLPSNGFLDPSVGFCIGGPPIDGGGPTANGMIDSVRISAGAWYPFDHSFTPPTGPWLTTIFPPRLIDRDIFYQAQLTPLTLFPPLVPPQTSRTYTSDDQIYSPDINGPTINAPGSYDGFGDYFTTISPFGNNPGSGFTDFFGTSSGPGAATFGDTRGYNEFFQRGSFLEVWDYGTNPGYGSLLVVGVSLGPAATTPQNFFIGASPYMISLSSLINSTGTFSFLSMPNARDKGNLLIAFIQVNAGNQTFSLTDGSWTLGGINTDANFSSAWAWRVRDGTESVPQFGWQTNAVWHGQMFEFFDSDPVSPIGNSSSAHGSSSTISIGGITSTRDMSCVLSISMTQNNQVIPVPAGYDQKFGAGTLAALSYNDNNGSDCVAMQRTFASGSAATSISDSITSTNWKAFQIEIRSKAETGWTMGDVSADGISCWMWRIVDEAWYDGNTEYQRWPKISWQTFSTYQNTFAQWFGVNPNNPIGNKSKTSGTSQTPSCTGLTATHGSVSAIYMMLMFRGQSSAGEPNFYLTDTHLSGQALLYPAGYNQMGFSQADFFTRGGGLMCYQTVPRGQKASDVSLSWLIPAKYTGNWQPNHAYNVLDQFTNGGILYYVVTAHTSQATFDPLYNLPAPPGEFFRAYSDLSVEDWHIFQIEINDVG